MPVIKQDRVMPFAFVHANAPFAFTTTIYSKSEGVEEPKEHIFFKKGVNKAITSDKRVVVYFAPNDNVQLCKLERNQ